MTVSCFPFAKKLHGFITSDFRDLYIWIILTGKRILTLGNILSIMQNDTPSATKPSGYPRIRLSWAKRLTSRAASYVLFVQSQ